MAGLQYYNLEQLEEALEYYDNSIKLDPNRPEYLYHRGMALQKSDKEEQAIDDFARALENQNMSEAEKFQAYFNKGICLRRLGDLKNSIDDLLNATKI